MRCVYPDCNVVERHPKQRVCWRKWQLCGVHANLLHPDDYDGRYIRNWINREGRFGSRTQQQKYSSRFEDNHFGDKAR